MKLSNKLTPSSQVIARDVGQEIVLLDLASGTYFGLDPVGARIWQLMRSGKTLDEVCDAMMEEYEVPRETLERDVQALARQLIEKQLAAAA